MLSDIRFYFRHLSLSAKRKRLFRDYLANTQKAKKAGDDDLIQRIHGEASTDDSLFNDEIETLITDRLLDQANWLFIRIPDRTDMTLWHKSDFGGQILLTRKGVSTLRAAIRTEQKERREFFVIVLTSSIGIIGAITGLVAVLHKTQ